MKFASQLQLTITIKECRSGVARSDFSKKLEMGKFRLLCKTHDF